jgi:cytochrome b561
MNALIIFALLIVLMLSGMPISIALGLTVLTFLFTLTDVIQDVPTKYQTSWAIIFIIFTCIFINLVIVLHEILVNIWGAYKNWRDLRK